jgi:class 3 adenylate cyclase
MQQIAEWLEKLGMSEYAERFAENKIDVSVLHHLTDQDLKDIGVALGHRRKILAAIAEFAGAAPAASKPVLAAEPKTRDSAERRQVTVLFSDLVGSTALSARMDPEDLREVISAYQKCVAETVGHFGGFVAKYMGDGVLVYFGYPQAHEDDAERAVRAGLEVIDAVARLKSRAPLQTRVGIATGMVVVGDLIGSGSAQEQAVVGEPPNLAARLQSIAEPNTVVIAESTRKLLGNLFELQDLGAKEVKGIAEPIQAWAALRPSAVESRFEALHASGLTALVGREEELELLLRRWSRAKTSEGQVVLLSGEAGMGKSRLTAALLERLAAEPHTRLRYFCSPQHTDSAFYPIIGQMERAAGFVHNDPPRAKLDKLDAVLAQTSTSGQDVALFAEMLSLPSDGRYPAIDLAPEQRRQRTLEALVSQMEALAWQSPVLMIFEDAHWSDPTSLEVLGRIVDRIRSVPVLLLVTFRPEFDPPWLGRAYVTALTINRLAQRDISAMIDRVGAASGKHPRGHHRAYRWHSSIRGGDDQGGTGSGERGRSRADRRYHSVTHPGGPGKPASITNGAARPPRSSQGGGADRGGNRQGVFPYAACCGRAEVGAGAEISVGPPRSSRSSVPPGRTAACELHVQARPNTGRSLQHTFARAPAGASFSHR